MKWIKVKDGHEWLKDDRIGIVASFDDKGCSTWYNRFGKVWESDPFKGGKESYFPMGFEECMEQEAKELLKSK